MIIMGASEILQALEKGDKLTSAEISEKYGYSLSSINQAIKRLLKDVSENLEVRALTSKEKEERYGRKIGTKIYIYWVDN